MLIMAFFMGCFWLYAARIASTETVGIATTLVAVMNLIAMLSLVGCDIVFIRFLAQSTRRNDIINTGLIIVVSVAILIALFFLLYVNELVPKLALIRGSVWSAFAFISLCVLTALKILVDAVFLSHRQAKYTFRINTACAPLPLLIVLINAPSGALSIFWAAAVPQLVGCIISLYVLVKEFGYRPNMAVSESVLKEMRTYSVHNYIASIVNLLPSTLLPILVINALGAAQAAFYGIVMMIGNVLYAVPWAVARALFAEGSHDHHALIQNIKKTVAVIAGAIVPAILVLVFFGDIALSLFGNAYAMEGKVLLAYIAVAAVPLSFLSILESCFRVSRASSWLMVINAWLACSILGLAYMLVPYGLLYVGVAWLVGYTTAAMLSLFLFWHRAVYRAQAAELYETQG